MTNEGIRDKGARGKGGYINPLSLIPFPLTFLILAAALLALLFISFPQIDVWVANLFYIEGQKFHLNRNIILETIHKSVRPLTTLMVLFLVGLIIATGIKKKAILGLTNLRAIYLLVALAVGPGLVVNMIFKDNWGRARPHHLELFAGTKDFTPAFVITDQCGTNCSFVSGDASVGFYFLALAFAFPAHRKLFTYVGLGMGALLGATRIMQGAHFLSDVIFSGIFTFTTAYLIYLLLLRIEKKQSAGLSK